MEPASEVASNISAQRSHRASGWLAAEKGSCADLAVDNLIEMRDTTASRVFRAKKKLDHVLEGLLPGIYLPLYTMVTFTRIPYSQSARRARRQDRIVYASLIAVLALLSILMFRFIGE